MKAGAHGSCPNYEKTNDALVFTEKHFAILVNEKHFQEFYEEIRNCPEIHTIYFVTDSEAGYREMASFFPLVESYQLYRDYLDNFRINVRS